MRTALLTVLLALLSFGALWALAGLWYVWVAWPLASTLVALGVFACACFVDYRKESLHSE